MMCPGHQRAASLGFLGLDDSKLFPSFWQDPPIMPAFADSSGALLWGCRRLRERLCTKLARESVARCQ